jgi:hypothetical protein
MAQYQKENNELGKSRFFDVFGDLSKEDQLKLAETLSKITKVCKL